MKYIKVYFFIYILSFIKDGSTGNCLYAFKSEIYVKIDNILIKYLYKSVDNFSDIFIITSSIF